MRIRDDTKLSRDVWRHTVAAASVDITPSWVKLAYNRSENHSTRLVDFLFFSLFPFVRFFFSSSYSYAMTVTLSAWCPNNALQSKLFPRILVTTEYPPRMPLLSNSTFSKCTPARPHLWLWLNAINSIINNSRIMTARTLLYILMLWLFSECDFHVWERSQEADYWPMLQVSINRL